MSSDQPRRSWVEQIMGMPISLLARGAGADAPGADASARSLFDELIAGDAVFSLYRAESELSRLGRGELSLDECLPSVREVARRCADAQARTGGLFDSTRPDGVWDPSGLVKGWAVEHAAKQLVTDPDIDWCVNAGGDVLVLTHSGIPFTVGIQDPRDPRRVAATIQRSSGAMATSGTAARGAHLYDPHTGAPAVTDVLSVTVAGPSLELADVLATAAFVSGDRWVEVVARVPGYDALAISTEGSVLTTPGWPRTTHDMLQA